MAEIWASSLRAICFVFLLLNSSVAVNTANSPITVNSESFLEVVTDKISDLESKMDLLLATSGTTASRTINGYLQTEERICSLSSRMIHLENEMDSVKSTSSLNLPTTYTAASAGSAKVISDLHSKLTALQDAFSEHELRTTELERRLQELNHTAKLPSSDPQAEAETDGSCYIGSLGISDQRPMSVVHHLQNMNFNVFLGKPSNASSLHPNHEFQLRSGVDGDYKTFYHSLPEKNPWFCLDLEVPHLLWQIKISIRETTRAGGLKIFVANRVKFDSYGQPEVHLLPLFGSQVGNSASTTMTFTSPRGVCGRYVIVYRDVINEYIIMSELQGIGYAFK